MERRRVKAGLEAVSLLLLISLLLGLFFQLVQYMIQHPPSWPLSWEYWVLLGVGLVAIFLIGYYEAGGEAQ